MKYTKVRESWEGGREGGEAEDTLAMYNGVISTVNLSIRTPLN